MIEFKFLPSCKRFSFKFNYDAYSLLITQDLGTPRDKYVALMMHIESPFI